MLGRGGKRSGSPLLSTRDAVLSRDNSMRSSTEGRRSLRKDDPDIDDAFTKYAASSLENDANFGTLLSPDIDECKLSAMSVIMVTLLSPDIDECKLSAMSVIVVTHYTPVIGNAIR